MYGIYYSEYLKEINEKIRILFWNVNQQQKKRYNLEILKAEEEQMKKEKKKAWEKSFLP